MDDFKRSKPLLENVSEKYFMNDLLSFITPSIYVLISNHGWRAKQYLCCKYQRSTIRTMRLI